MKDVKNVVKQALNELFSNLSFQSKCLMFLKLSGDVYLLIETCNKNSNISSYILISYSVFIKNYWNSEKVQKSGYLLANREIEKLGYKEDVSKVLNRESWKICSLPF